MANSNANLKRHMKLCAICNHKDRKDIEDDYLRGTSPYQIETDYPGVSNISVYKHTKIFGLDKRRDDSTLTIVNMIIDRGNAQKIKITPAMWTDALKLRAKLKGEIIDKQEVKEVLDDYSDAQLAVIAEQSRAIIGSRTAQTVDQGNEETGVQKPIREATLIPTDPTSVQ